LVVRGLSCAAIERDLKVARQHIASIEQQIAGTVVALNGDPNIEIDRHPTVRAANAQLDRPGSISPMRRWWRPTTVS
jgi:hypothetical protein